MIKIKLKTKDTSHRNPFVAISEDAPIKLAIDRMRKKKAHRLASMNSAGELRDLLSQSGIVRFLGKHLEELPFASKTIEELSLGYRDVVTVSIKKHAFHAFQEMVKHKIGGIGITNEDGILVANLSASDLKV